MGDIVPALVGWVPSALILRCESYIYVRPPTVPCAAVLGWNFRAVTMHVERTHLKTVKL